MLLLPLLCRVARSASPAAASTLASADAYVGDGAGAAGWSAETMQQTELVDLVLDVGLATKAFPMTKISSLFEAENKRNGAGDQDLELYEFLQLLVILAHKRANATPGSEGLVPVGEALWQMIAKHLSRSARLCGSSPLPLKPVAVTCLNTPASSSTARSPAASIHGRHGG